MTGALLTWCSLKYGESVMLNIVGLILEKMLYRGGLKYVPVYFLAIYAGQGYSGVRRSSRYNLHTKS